ncbi:MAG: conjugal transfer protein TraD [Rickettsia endosymbiont of Platyusa sonomae]|nr:conjugal transfer protein TraD [Rickettsia endosymbiont of Platyusa sonomae]
MHEALQQKQKLQQKKARLIMEEINFKIKERKMRTRHLIEMGGLVAKAELDNLPTNSLFGALISLKNEITKHPDTEERWTKIGKDIFDQEEKNRSAIILKFSSKPKESIRTHIRQHGLKWNALRKEWYGYIIDMQSLKNGLLDIEYQLEIVSSET